MKVDVSFITVTMNNIGIVENLFRSFYETIPADVSYEYFVIDNCSTDGTPEFVRKNFPEVSVFKNSQIKGFAENNNIGMKKAKGKIIALINPDIIFLPNFIEPIMDLFVLRKDVGLVGPQLLNRDGTVQNSARKFLNIKTAAIRLLTLGKDSVKLKAIKNYLNPYDLSMEYQVVEWVIGAAMFVRDNALDEVGMFDTNFFLYIEDQDWCFQMWKQKWKVMYSTKSKLIHDHQRSSARRFSRKTMWHVQSILYFLRKNRKGNLSIAS